MFMEGCKIWKFGMYVASKWFMSANEFCRLLSTVDYNEAKQLLDDEQTNMMAIADNDTTAQSAAKAGIEFLGYIKTTWMPEALWQGWSQKGRVVAAMLLNIPIEGVLPTTNHLESFNCLLKRRYMYIPRWQRSGARLRFDFLIHILITKILPEIFAVRRSLQLYSTWFSARFRQSAGGRNLREGVSTTGDAANSTRLVCRKSAARRRGRSYIQATTDLQPPASQHRLD